MCIISDGTLPTEFNETLNFDVESEALLTTVVFLLMVSHRSVPEVRKASLTLWSLDTGQGLKKEAKVS